MMKTKKSPNRSVEFIKRYKVDCQRAAEQLSPELLYQISKLPRDHHTKWDKTFLAVVREETR